MVVWFAHVRVGHRQLPIPKSPHSIRVGAFSCITKNRMNQALSFYIRSKAGLLAAITVI